MELIADRRIGSQFSVVIANADITGLNESEEAMFDDWASEFGKNDYPIMATDVEAVWGKCDITGFESDCNLVRIYRQHQ